MYEGRKTDPEGTRRQGDRLAGGAGARERLLAELPVTERRLRLNGISTAVLEGGEGQPVVLLHGPGEYGAKWLRVIPDLVTTYRVIVPDLPGQGSSEAFDGPLDADRVRGWLDDLIECACSTAPALVGHVVGGAIAARFAAHHGETLRRLVLVDTLGLTAFQPEPEFGQALMEFMTQPTAETHDRLWGRCAYDFDTMRRRIGERWSWIEAYNLELARDPGHQAALHGLMEQFGMPAIPPEELARIAVPTSLIWGRHDRATPLPVARAASDRHGWPLHVIDGAGDDPAMEQPEAFVQALRGALGDSGGGARISASDGRTGGRHVE